jgi:hypothetical protein
MEVKTIFPFTSEPFKLVWDEYEKHRKEKKASKYTPTGLKRVLRALVRDSNNNEEIAIKIIEQSLEKNWTGLFPLKTNTNGLTTNTTSNGQFTSTAISKTEALANW